MRKKGRSLHLGEGDRELEMMRIIELSGWRGPVGIIDHREETDSEVTLRNNLLGLNWLRKELVKPGSGGKRPVYAAAAKPAPATAELAAGRFGKALNVTRGGLLMAGNDAWRAAPFTVEAWAKFDCRRLQRRGGQRHEGFSTALGTILVRRNGRFFRLSARSGRRGAQSGEDL